VADAGLIAPYILAFDNTKGTATGIGGGTRFSTQQVNVPVVVRNDAGAQIRERTRSLCSERALRIYPWKATNIRRPTRIFAAPSSSISPRTLSRALGIRIPDGPRIRIRRAGACEIAAFTR